MRRTSVVIDEKLLDEAVRLSGERTYSATINRALQDLIRRIKVEQGLKILSGSGWWEGDLEQMRAGHELDVADAPVAGSKGTDSQRDPG